MNNLTHWLGKTARIAETLRKAVPKLKTTPDPLERRYLFTGPPGCGKSALAKEMGHLLTGDSLEAISMYGGSINVQTKIGTSVSIDDVRRWQEAGRYRSMGNITQVVIIDEVDELRTALTEIRQWLDCLPPGWVVFATTNKRLEELQEQLQSRFKVCAFEKIQPADISHWLQVAYQLTPAETNRIAQGVNGNVRSARLDAMNLIEAKG